MGAEITSISYYWRFCHKLIHRDACSGVCCAHLCWPSSWKETCKSFTDGQQLPASLPAIIGKIRIDQRLIHLVDLFVLCRNPKSNIQVELLWLKQGWVLESWIPLVPGSSVISHFLSSWTLLGSSHPNGSVSSCSVRWWQGESPWLNGPMCHSQDITRVLGSGEHGPGPWKGRSMLLGLFPVPSEETPTPP